MERSERMAYEMKTAARSAHHVILEDRERLSVSGVADVASFDENEIVMLTDKGSLVVRGSGLKIGKLSIEGGDLAVEGLITDLSYEETKPSSSLWSRLFG